MAKTVILIALAVIGSFFLEAQAQLLSGAQYGNLEAIQSRAAQLNPPDKDLPEVDQFMYDEVRRIDDELRELRGISIGESEKAAQGQLDAMKKEIAAAVQGIASLDCKKADASRLRQLVVPFGKVQSYVARKYFNEDVDAPQPNPFATAFWFGMERPKFDAAFCTELKAFVGDAANQQLFVSYLDKLMSSLSSEQKKMEDYKKAADSLADLLQKRRASIQSKLASKATQQQIGSSLWAVILIIGGLSVLAIYAVKTFDSNIQMEWVASGQVIQFVTVMVLLSVVMALGLANVLKENTLGTLLGGIAGYVLAQGVGRAAAREMQRDRLGGIQTPSPTPTPTPTPSASPLPGSAPTEPISAVTTNASPLPSPSPASPPT